MRQRTQFATRPKDAEIITGSQTMAVFREDVQEVETENGTEYTALEYILPLSPSHTLEARLEQNKAAWLELAKRLDYDETAAKVREVRDKLLQASDKEMTIDRLIKDPSGGSSIADFLPFLKALLSAITGKMAKYRQALRDVPQQEGFPYHVVWPEVEKGDDVD